MYNLLEKKIFFLYTFCYHSQYVLMKRITNSSVKYLNEIKSLNYMLALVTENTDFNNLVLRKFEKFYVNLFPCFKDIPVIKKEFNLWKD